MARNGSGTYSLPSGNPVVTGTTISSATHNTTMSDIATALTASLAKDGQTTPSANLPMGTYKHTGVGASTATTDYARTDQVQNGSFTELASVAGTDTITGSVTPTPAAYAAGQMFAFIAAATNTGAATLNISSLGAKAITKNGTTALDAGDIPTGAVALVRYDGTQFQLLNVFIDKSLYATLAGDNAFTGANTFAAEQTFNHLVTMETGANIASATTVDLTAATGNIVHITGTTATTGFTMNSGQQMELIADAAWPLTYDATNCNINNGGGDYTCAAGDRLRVYYDGTTTFVDVQNLICVASGSFTFDTSSASSTNVSVTGLNFKPSLVELWASSLISARHSSGQFSQSDAGACAYQSGTFSYTVNDNAALLMAQSGTNVQTFTGTIDANGFTLANTKAGTPTGTQTIYYKAWR